MADATKLSTNMRLSSLPVNGQNFTSRARAVNPFFHSKALLKMRYGLWPILTSQHYLSFSHVASLIQNEETGRATTGVKHSPQNNSENTAAIFIRCDHCKKDGHTRDDCKLLHPELRPVRGRNLERGGGEKEKKKLRGGDRSLWGEKRPTQAKVDSASNLNDASRSNSGQNGQDYEIRQLISKAGINFEQQKR